MINILDRNKISSAEELVLQPQTDIDKVRKYLHTVGFKIDDEQMLYEDGIYYTVIRAVHGEEKYNREEDYLFGKINIEKKCHVPVSYTHLDVYKRQDGQDKRAFGRKTPALRVRKRCYNRHKRLKLIGGGKQNI